MDRLRIKGPASRFLVLLAAAASLEACSDGEGSLVGSGGANAVGGSAVASGGSTEAAGGSAEAAGGSAEAGTSSSTGGTSGGVASTSGGSSAGSSTTGGTTGGSGGGATSVGGKAASGGTGTSGGAANSGGSSTGNSGGTAPVAGNGPGGESASGGASAGGGESSGGAAPEGGGNAGGAASGGESSAQGGTAGESGSSGGTASAEGGSTAETGGTAGAAGGPSALRPQLTDTEAENATILKYLAQAGVLSKTGAGTVDNWDPTAGVGDASTLPADYLVGSASYPTVQSAITAAAALGVAATRVYIQVPAGTYREVICVPATAPPITLYGTNTDASQTTIVYNNISGLTVGTDIVRNPCVTSSSTTVGTDGSATVAVYAADFQALNLTIANDADESTVSSGTAAVALLSREDRAVFQNVRLLGNQDTVIVKTNSVNNARRSYFKGCYIEGDTDFIAGRGTAVIDDSEIYFVTTRKTTGAIVEPSTDARNPYGILVINSRFTSSGATVGTVSLGRAWDEGQTDLATYQTNYAAATATAGTGSYPNGQAVIRNSTLAAHIAAEPWEAAGVTGRPYSPVAGTDLPANRLYEYLNSGPGSATP